MVQTFKEALYVFFIFFKLLFPLLFITSLPPKLRRTDTKKAVWEDGKAGGTGTYRLTGRTAGKESDPAIVSTIQRIEAEVAALEDTVVTRVCGKKVFVKHTVVTSMLDGKCR